MDIFDQFAANTDIEENGLEVEIGINTFITVARSGNKKYTRILTKLYETHRHELDQKGPDAEYRADQITIETMAKAVLLGWRGITFKGQPMEYSLENARTLLAVKDFRLLVNKHADNFQNFRAVKEEEDVKKSETVSLGKLIGVPT
jgi:transposase-like protein